MSGFLNRIDAAWFSGSRNLRDPILHLNEAGHARAIVELRNIEGKDGHKKNVHFNKYGPAVTVVDLPPGKAAFKFKARRPFA